MQGDPTKILIDSIKRLLRRNALTHLKKIVNKTHAADLSLVFRSLSISNQHKLFEMIEETEQKGILFSELDEDTFLALNEGIELEDVVEIFEQMPTDDVADLLGRLPEERSDAIIERMKKESSEEVEGLLHYEDDTAGGIMVPEFIALKESTTAEDAIHSLQKEHLDVEMPFYLYVVNEYGNLVGVSSLRQLVVVPDFSGNGAPEIGALQVDDTREQVRVAEQRHEGHEAAVGAAVDTDACRIDVVVLHEPGHAILEVLERSDARVFHKDRYTCLEILR